MDEGEGSSGDTSLGTGQHSLKSYLPSLPSFRAAPWVSAWSLGGRVGGGETWGQAGGCAKS